MNLSMDVWRWLSVRAIRGRTWAGDRVFDSPSTPADIRTAEEREPFISIYCDDADFTFDTHGGLNGTAEDTQARLVIEVGVSSPIVFDDAGRPPDDVESSAVSELNATDEALEAQIGFISRQVQQTLLSTQENNPWAELWRWLAGSVKRIEIRRGGPVGDDNKPKPRYASRVTILHCSLIDEPMRGEYLDPEGFWPKVIAAFLADEELSGIGELLRAHIESPSGPLPEWRVAQKHLTTTRDVIEGIGVAPVQGWDDKTIEHPAVLQKVTVDGEGHAADFVADTGPDGDLE